ncbi:MAG: hypothetical protein FD138_2740 [Planctomycetota bacterium]|nr:MAG: hypothetical protein FD138_2740 [Planctomycetota bacterium]
MRNLMLFSCVTLSLVIATTVSGCGGGGADVGPKTVPVSGVVTLQGKPLEGATVYFQSDKFTGFGKTNADGKYELVQGAVPGDNKIRISKLELPAGTKLDPEAGMDLGQLQAAADASAADRSGKVAKVQGPKELVPDEFSNPTTAKLKFPVPANGSTSADFRL